MKKVFVLISIVLCMSLLGCSKKEESEPFDTNTLKKVEEPVVITETKTDTEPKDMYYYNQIFKDTFVLDLDNIVFRLCYDNNSRDIYLYLNTENKEFCVLDTVNDTFFAGYNTGYYYIGSQDGLKKFNMKDIGIGTDFMQQAFDELESSNYKEKIGFEAVEIKSVTPGTRQPEYTIVTTTAKAMDSVSDDDLYTATWFLNTDTDDFEMMTVSYIIDKTIVHNYYYRPDTNLLKYDLTMPEEELQGLVTEELTGLSAAKEFLANVDILKQMLTF